MRAGKQRATQSSISLESTPCEECSRCAVCAERAFTLAARRGPLRQQQQKDGKPVENDGVKEERVGMNRQRRGQRSVWKGGTPEAGIGSSSSLQGYKYTVEPCLHTPSGTAVHTPCQFRQSISTSTTVLDSATLASSPSEQVHISCAARARSRTRTIRHWPLFLTSLLPFLPLASARPPPTRTALNPKRTLATEAPAPPPSGVLPTSITPVKETALPYRLEFDEDQQKWVPVEGWVKYGRGFDRSSEDVFINDSFAADPPSWAVSEVLPRGWGQTSDRSSLYKTPLIAISSIILAALIVTGLLVIFISQRRTHRKALRRRTKERAKALKAAGIDIDSADHRAVDALYHEKIEAKPKNEGRKGLTTAKKVGKWRKGLRRRKLGQSPSGSLEQVVVVEDEDLRRSGSGDPEGSREEDGARVQPTDDGEASNANPPDTRSSGEENAVTDLSDQSTRPSDGDPSASVSRQSASTAAPTGNPPQFFPPAYRPASVRSLYQPEPSRALDTDRTPGSSTPPPPHPSSSAAVGQTSDQGRVLSARAQEKSQAAYYPAPTTLEAEQALAVALAAESGQPSVSGAGHEEEDSTTAHVATDDKQLLERLRVRGSRPPTASQPGDDQPGVPTAPVVEVDEDGFERLDVGPSSSAVPEEEDVAQSSSALPLPPRPTVQRSLLALGSTSPLSPSAPLQPFSPVLPSAPSAPPPEESDVIAPSAPALDEPETDDDDELEYSSPPQPSQSALPSVSTEDTAEDLAAHQARVGAAPENGVKVTFLPKYEP